MAFVGPSLKKVSKTTLIISTTKKGLNLQHTNNFLNPKQYVDQIPYIDNTTTATMSLRVK